jgi:flagellin-like hook-associated protein FlgL
MRIASNTAYRRLNNTLQGNYLKLFRAQEQISTGLRVSKPSDDPASAARIIQLRQRLARNESASDAAGRGGDVLNAGSARLGDAASLLSEARALIVQAQNGTLSPADREAIGTQMFSLRDQLLSYGNAEQGGRFLFSGSATAEPAFQELKVGDSVRALYAGDDLTQKFAVGAGVELGINVPGDVAFGGAKPTGVSLSGKTGLQLGETGSQGHTYEELLIDQTGTTLDPALIAAGVASVPGQDTLLGSDTLTIDAAAGTIALGSGDPLLLPDPTSPEAQNFTVTNGDGAEIRLDLSGYAGAGVSAAVTGSAEISISGGTPVAIDFTETDLRLENSTTGSVVHVDTTQLTVSGTELAVFGGSTNAIDLLQATAEALVSQEDIGTQALLERLSVLSDEVESRRNGLLSSQATLGGRAKRVENIDRDLQSVRVRVIELLSEEQDVDMAEVALELQQTEFALQSTQAVAGRVLPRSLLDFLR